MALNTYLNILLITLKYFPLLIALYLIYSVFEMKGKPPIAYQYFRDRRTFFTGKQRREELRGALHGRIFAANFGTGRLEWGILRSEDSSRRITPL